MPVKLKLLWVSEFTEELCKNMKAKAMFYFNKPGPLCVLLALQVIGDSDILQSLTASDLYSPSLCIA